MENSGNLDCTVLSQYSQEAYFTSLSTSLGWLCICEYQMCWQCILSPNQIVP